MIKLDVPYFKQTMIGSCGPAALMMVLKYHWPKLKTDRRLEFSAWIYAQLFPFGMTDAHGLAGFAATKGLDSLVLKEEKEFELYFEYGHLRRLFTGLMLPFLRFNYNRIRIGALNCGVRERYGKIGIDTIEQLIRSGRPPIVMVDQTGYAPDDDYRDGVLHWVVVTGFDSESIWINDPDLGALVVSKTGFAKALDLRRNFGTDRRIVVVALKEHPETNRSRTSSFSEPQ